MARRRKARLRFSKRGIYLVTTRGSRRVADPISVIAFGSLESGPGEEKAFTVIKFLNCRGAWKRKTLPSAIFTTPRELITKLAAAGYIWPPKYRLRILIIAALSIKKPVRDVIMVEVPGQHGKYYVLPDESYGPKGPDRKKFMLIDNPTVKPRPIPPFGNATAMEEVYRPGSLHSLEPGAPRHSRFVCCPEFASA